MQFRVAMNFQTENDQLGHAVNASRSAQTAYGRAYFEQRQLTTGDSLAELRLTHSLAQAELEQFLLESGHSLPKAKEDVGPFAEDPRFQVFGLEPHLVTDYLLASEKGMSALYTSLRPEFALSEEVTQRRDKALVTIKKCHEQAFPESQSTGQATRAPWERCG